MVTWGVWFVTCNRRYTPRVMEQADRIVGRCVSVHGRVDPSRLATTGSIKYLHGPLNPR